MKIEFKEIKTKSNLLSLLRLFLFIPVLIYATDIEANRTIMFVIVGFGFISDLLDGYLARKFDEVTEFGKIIDPLADKVVIIALIIQMFLSGVIPLFYFLIIVLRDIIIFTGGVFVSKKIGKVLPSNYLGKMTVFSIGMFIIGLISGLQSNDILYNVLMYVSVILSFASVIGYAIRGYEAVKWMDKNENI